MSHDTSYGVYGHLYLLYSVFEILTSSTILHILFDCFRESDPCGKLVTKLLLEKQTEILKESTY